MTFFTNCMSKSWITWENTRKARVWHCFSRWFCLSVTLNIARSTSTRSFVEVQYCQRSSHIMSLGHPHCPLFDILANKGLTSQANGVHRKRLIIMQCPVRELEDVSWHFFIPLTLFNHLPSRYAGWRTLSTTSSCCHGLPPGPSIGDPTASDPQGARLQTCAQTLTMPH